MQQGFSAEGELSVTDGGYFPPLLLVEAMAQIGGIAAGQQEGVQGVLAALGRVRLPSRIEGGARLLVSSRVVKTFGDLVLLQGEVREEGEVIASADLTLALESISR